ncbi:MAG: hypothetical protein ACFFGP_08050 [Promethearchaeota archaeon]
MTNDIKVFKLNYAGDLKDISGEDLFSNFTLFDILTFYVSSQRRLYIWIGKRVSHSLKSHIPSIREIFLRSYPNLKIIRNIIVEYDSEPSEFFETIEISKDQYKEHFKQLEFKLLPVLSKINRLKDDADKNFVLGNYQEAIALAQKVIKLAQEIEDYSLENEILSFIEEAKTNSKAKQIVREIEIEAEIKLKVFDNLIRAENYKEAHKIAQEFRTKHERNINLLTIPFAQDLILKDENLLYSLREEQEVLKKKFEVLGRKVEKFIKHSQMLQAGKMLKNIETLTEKLIDIDIKNKLDLLKSKFSLFRNQKKRDLEELSKEALGLLEKRKISEVIEKYDNIIELLEIFIS